MNAERRGQSKTLLEAVGTRERSARGQARLGLPLFRRDTTDLVADASGFLHGRHRQQAHYTVYSHGGITLTALRVLE